MVDSNKLPDDPNKSADSAQWDALVASTAALTRQARVLASKSESIEFVHPDGDRTALASRDASIIGGWRITQFDASGPIGHGERTSLADAVLTALESGYTPKAAPQPSTCLPSTISTTDVKELQEQLRAVEGKYELLRVKGVRDGPEWMAISKEAAPIHVRLFELTGDHYGRPKVRLSKPSDEALEAQYLSPDDVPSDVRRWVQKNSNLLTSDATDAVRWGRITDTLDDDRYESDDLTVYRAVANGDEIRPGDWVTTDRKYASDHLARWLDGKGCILEETVDGRDVLMSPTGNYEEAIYAPRALSGPVASEPDADCNGPNTSAEEDRP